MSLNAVFAEKCPMLGTPAWAPTRGNAAGGHGLRQQQDACIVDKDNNSCGTYIVEDKRRGGTANPSIGGEGVNMSEMFFLKSSCCLLIR